MYGQANNHLLNTFPGIFEIILAYPESVTTGAMTLDLGAVSFYRLKLHGLSNVVKVYTAFLDAYKCTEKKSGMMLYTNKIYNTVKPLKNRQNKDLNSNW